MVLGALQNQRCPHILRYDVLGVWGLGVPLRRDWGSMLIRLPLPQRFRLRGTKLRPWSKQNSGQNSDHPRLCTYWGKEKLRPWSKFLRNEKAAPRVSFGARYPADVHADIMADVRWQKLRSGPRYPGKTSISVQTSMTRRRGRP